DGGPLRDQRASEASRAAAPHDAVDGPEEALAAARESLRRELVGLVEDEVQRAAVCRLRLVQPRTEVGEEPAHRGLAEVTQVEDDARARLHDYVREERAARLLEGKVAVLAA